MAQVLGPDRLVFVVLLVEIYLEEADGEGFQWAAVWVCARTRRGERAAVFPKCWPTLLMTGCCPERVNPKLLPSPPVVTTAPLHSELGEIFGLKPNKDPQKNRGPVASRCASITSGIKNGRSCFYILHGKSVLLKNIKSVIKADRYFQKWHCMLCTTANESISAFRERNISSHYFLLTTQTRYKSQRQQ